MPTKLALPAIDSQLQRFSVEKDGKALDRFRGVAAVEGTWTHPYKPYSVELDMATLEKVVDNINKYGKEKKSLEIYCPKGHTRDSTKNLGYVDVEAGARIVEVDFRGEKRKGIELVYDIRDEDAKKGATDGTLKGCSVLFEPDFRISNPDGSVDAIGPMFEHVAFVPNPVITGMPALEPMLSRSSDGSETEIIPLEDQKLIRTLARRGGAATVWKDPPKDIASGARKATHDECNYTLGTPDMNCARCLFYYSSYSSYAIDPQPMCEVVEPPILRGGLCDYFRPRVYSFDASRPFDVELTEDGLPNLFAKDPAKPFGDVEYADPGYQEDGKSRFPLDTKERVGAALSYLGQEKTGKKYSPSQLKAIKSRIKSAAVKFGIEVADERKEEPMPVELKVLSREIGVPETEDVKVFAKSIEDRGALALARSLGVDISDAAKAADAIREHFGKQGAADRALATRNEELVRQNAELARERDGVRDEMTKELSKRDAKIEELTRINLLGEKESRLGKIEARIEKCMSTGRMTKAEVDGLLAQVGSQDKPFALEFDRSGKTEYGSDWDRSLDRLDAKLEVYEARAEGSQVPGEATPRALDRGRPPAPGNGQFDPKKELEEGAKLASVFRRKKEPAQAG